jgi:hypothetical protein
MVLGTLVMVKFTLVNLRASWVAPKATPVPVAVLAAAEVLVEWLEDLAMDGATALRVRTVARPMLAAVVVRTTDFFMVGTFLGCEGSMHSDLS